MAVVCRFYDRISKLQRHIYLTHLMRSPIFNKATFDVEFFEHLYRKNSSKFQNVIIIFVHLFLLSWILIESIK